MKKLLLFIFFITFGVFVFFADSLLEDYVINEIEARTNHVLRGKTEIGHFHIGRKGFVFRHIYSYNDASKEASLLFSADKVVVPFLYPFQTDKEFINIEGLHLNVLFDNNYNLNLLRVTKATEATQKDAVNMPTVPIRIKIKDATFNCLLFIDGERFLLKGKKTNAVGHIADNRIIYSAVSEGENIGECFSEGILDFSTLDFSLAHKFTNIEMTPFSQRFLNSIFSFTKDFDFKGFVKIKIQNEWKNKRIQPAKYDFSFKKTDLIHKDVPLLIDDVVGDLKVSDGFFFAKDVSGVVSVQALKFPAKNVSAKGDFTKAGKVNITDITGLLFSGQLKAEVDVAISKRCTISSSLNNANAKSFFTNMQSGAIPETGVVNFSGKFEVTNQKENGWDTEGVGVISVEETNMGSIPFFLSLFSLLDFSLPTQDNISNIYAQWVYKNKDLALDNLAIRGEKLGFYGGGVVRDLNTLDITLVARLREAKPFAFPPVIGDITRFASNKMLKTLAKVKITGTVDEPQFSK